MLFSLGRSSLCCLLIAIIAFAAATSIATAFMPPDPSATAQANTPPIATSHVQHQSGPHHAAAIHDSTTKPKPNPKRRHTQAARTRRVAKQTPPLRFQTRQSKQRANILAELHRADLREPPTQRPTQTNEHQPLLDLRAALERMDDLAQIYRNRNQMSELKAAITQRVHAARRVAELEAAAARNGGETALIASLGTGGSNRSIIGRGPSAAERQYMQTQNEISGIDRQIAQLQRRRASLERQLASLDERRDTQHTRLAHSRSTTPAGNPAAAGNKSIDATRKTERLVDTTHQFGDDAAVITDLRGTLRELKAEVARAGDEFLRARQNLMQRFGEIERRSNVIEAEIRARMQMRANAGVKTPRRSNRSGEHTALGPQED